LINEGVRIASNKSASIHKAPNPNIYKVYKVRDISPSQIKEQPKQSNFAIGPTSEQMLKMIAEGKLPPEGIEELYNLCIDTIGASIQSKEAERLRLVRARENNAKLAAMEAMNNAEYHFQREDIEKDLNKLGNSLNEYEQKLNKKEQQISISSISSSVALSAPLKRSYAVPDLKPYLEQQKKLEQLHKMREQGKLTEHQMEELERFEKWRELGLQNFARQNQAIQSSSANSSPQLSSSPVLERNAPEPEPIQPAQRVSSFVSKLNRPSEIAPSSTSLGSKEQEVIAKMDKMQTEGKLTEEQKKALELFKNRHNQPIQPSSATPVQQVSSSPAPTISAPASPISKLSSSPSQSNRQSVQLSQSASSSAQKAPESKNAIESYDTRTTLKSGYLLDMIELLADYFFSDSYEELIERTCINEKKTNDELNAIVTSALGEGTLSEENQKTLVNELRLINDLANGTTNGINEIPFKGKYSPEKIVDMVKLAVNYSIRDTLKDRSPSR
jgi:hypothetical protein